MSDSSHVYAVLLAGGGGTRLWPKSRSKTPKQLLTLVEKSSMVQVAAGRVSQVIPWERMIVVTNKQYLDQMQAQLPQVPTENFIAEPEKKETALAMLVGALFAKSKDPDAVVLNSAADHVITDEKEFIRVMNAALQVASEKKYLVTVGITPTRPETGFGYIKIGEHLRNIHQDLPLFKVESFTEKPSRATAQAFISTGKYFWNANMYVWSVATMEAAFEKYKPELYLKAKHLSELSPEKFHKALPDVYKDAEPISVDYAISEKADNLVLLPGDFGWNDVGDWKVVYELGKKDLAGNVVIGDGQEAHTLGINAQNNLIHTNGRLVALVGIDDTIIIDTDDILLVVPKSRSQDVKKLVERLKEEGKKEYL